MVNRRLGGPCLLFTLGCVLASPSWGGRNADGALIVHTDPAVTYSQGFDCSRDYPDPGSCANARTQVETGSQSGVSVVWLLASFPEGSSPAVSVIQFGITYTVSRGAIVAYGPCDPIVAEIPSAGFPESNSGISVAFYPVPTETLFPVYWFAINGNPGGEFGTTVDPIVQQAVFVESGAPAGEDEIHRFGRARWGSAGQNECPPTQQRRDARWGEVKSGYRDR